MLKRIIMAGIVMLLLFGAMGGAMGSEMEERGKHGYFNGTTFNNKQEIDGRTNPMEYTYRWLIMLYLDGDNNLYSEIFKRYGALEWYELTQLLLEG